MGKGLQTFSYILLFGLLIGRLVYQLLFENISSLGRTALGYFAAGIFSVRLLNVGVLAIGLSVAAYRRSKASIQEL